MKRRSTEPGKSRRQLKRSKIAESFYSSTFIYLKFLLVWAIMLTLDFILEFRFEYLWPFWLMINSVYDSFKYQGLAFSVFFICLALTSDMICLLFIPVNWLFFAASTYVWVQYVWYTERGICLPTVSLWLLFVYVEGSIRLKDFSVRPLPFHLDLCRPFAAHCIGYPIITLGFGFKSYMGYRLLQRKQKDVAKDNKFCFQLLQQALPAEQPQTNHVSVLSTTPSTPAVEKPKHNGAAHTVSDERVKQLNTVEPVVEKSKKSKKEISSSTPSSARVDTSTSNIDLDMKKYKADLQYSRQIEQELRSQLSQQSQTEKLLRCELDQLRQENENLQTKLSIVTQAKQSDKQVITQLEKKLQEERKGKAVAESMLLYERKSKKVEEAAARAAASNPECPETCKSTMRDLDYEIKQLKREVKIRDEQMCQMQRETQSLRVYKDQQSETEALVSSLSAMQDKASHLEKSLSAETRIKLDLFSALGDCRRQLEIAQSQLAKKNQEIYELKAKMVEMMAVMPHGPLMSPTTDGNTSSMIFSPTFSQRMSDLGDVCDGSLCASNLDPNATIYTPKSN